MIADNAIYVDGRRAAQQPSSLQETYEILRQLDDAVAWIDLYKQTKEVEDEVFGGNADDVSQRIYELSRELVQFQRATSPLARSLERGGERNEHDIDPELRSYLHELHDRVLRVVEPTEGFRDMLSDILVVNLTLIGVRQNDQTKKISAWAAILIVPTLITGIYGMNFDFMPELHWTFGYPLALALMVSISVGLYAVFRHVRWL